MGCLKAFKGTIIFVSHDRGFMEALSTKTLELSYGDDPQAVRQHRLFYGNYAYYLERIALEAGEGFKASSRPATADESGRLQVDALSASERREKEKQRQALVRRQERREAEILKKMEELETEKSRLEGELARPEVYSSSEKAKAVKLKLDESVIALEAKSREWETVAEELSKLYTGIEQIEKGVKP
jgi:ATP-binding cassette subfamily F protein 3